MYIYLLKKNKKYFFYSRSLDFTNLNEESLTPYTNSYSNYKRGTISDHYHTTNFLTSGEENIVIVKFGIEFTYTFRTLDNSIYLKGFYFWTYGPYSPGFTENLTINLTNTSTGLYNLSIQPSDIIWWPNPPNPPNVTNTYCGIPNDTTISIAFSGLVDPGQQTDDYNQNTALGQSNGIYNLMIGAKCCSLGGGSTPFTSAVIAVQKSAILSGQFIKYDVICFDIEVGDSGLATDFEDLFAAAKSVSLGVFVTISHTAPYGISDGKILMTSFFQSMNIDCISPQLYTFDFGTTCEYAENNQLSWDEFSQLYINRSNQNLIVSPSLFSNTKSNIYGTFDLLATGGTNDGLIPINFINPKYTIDTGAKNFFTAFGINSYGSIQWINGVLKPV